MRFGRAVIVVDASVLVTALVDEATDGRVARLRLAGQRLVGPDLLPLEVLSVIRRRCQSGALTARRGELAIGDLSDLPVQYIPHNALLRRCWELRDNLTAYDAAYVAVAEQFDAPLVTADAKLTAAPGARCEIELLTTPGGQAQ